MSLEQHIAESERCSQCSYCKWIPLDQIKSIRFANGCPSIAYNNFNSYSARGRYLVAAIAVDGPQRIQRQGHGYRLQMCDLRKLRRLLQSLPLQYGTSGNDPRPAL